MQKTTTMLQDLSRKIRELGSPKFTRKVIKTFGAQSVKLVSDGFRNSCDPYGKKWEPLRSDTLRNLRHGKRKERWHKPLIDTARMRNSFTWTPTGDLGFRVLTNVEYAGHHQHGTKNIPRRTMVPEAQYGGFGPIWGVAFEKMADHILRTQVAV